MARERRSGAARDATSVPPIASPDDRSGELREEDGALLVRAHVTPRASREVISVEAGQLRVWLRQPPVEGAANRALLKLLAERLRLPLHALALRRGATGREKQIAVMGLTAEELWRRLADTPRGQK
ncbi:MAG TPA: DUF167 domain-containing protein [Ktedonobacterales bacterium]|nr:DUF167 domain-containing protein [Ktedonobacterales bacterium]